MKTVVNLVDDYRPGGIKSLLDDMAAVLTRPDLDWQIKTVNSAVATTLNCSPDVIVVHYSMAWRKLPALLYLRLKHPRAKLVIVEHHYTKSFEQHHVSNKGRFRFLLRTAYRLANVVIAVSRAQSDWLRAAGVADLEKIRVIPSCRDYSRFLAIPRIANRNETIVIGAMGRLVHNKGFDVLIHAMRNLPADRFQLRIAGDGEELESLQGLAEGMRNVEFIGHLDDPADFLGECDVLAMPSRMEAFGLVCAEAKAAGLPVVVTNVDALPMQASDCGAVVEADDIDGLAEALQYIAKPHRLHSLGERARKSVVNAWSQYLSAWSKVLA